jgi:NAD(P)-dependent dehydrogenase (short-subunit alcohol dehydrogenase family)
MSWQQRRNMKVMSDTTQFSQINAQFSMRGKTVVLTGAAGRLGSAMAVGLAAAGAKLWLAGRNEASLKKVQTQITTAGGQADVATVDLQDEKSLQSFTQMLAAKSQKINALVNNAYAGETGTIETITAKQFADVYNITVVAAAELVRQLLPSLQEAVAQDGDAAVLNICSMYGMVSPDQSIYGDSGMNSPPHYGSAKGALIQYTRYAACHLAPRGIRVNAISPGPFPPADFKTAKPAFHDALTKKVPLQRIGRPDELIGAAVFLCSSASTYVTGVNLPVDGGWTAW